MVNCSFPAINPSQGGQGIGQQQPKTNAYLPGGRGREASASEMVPAPFPIVALGRAQSPKAVDTQCFSLQPKEFWGRGERTISDAEVPFPPPQRKHLLAKRSGCPNPSISLAGGTVNRPINPNLKFPYVKNPARQNTLRDVGGSRRNQSLVSNILFSIRSAAFWFC